jgi:hypothetical protein
MFSKILSKKIYHGVIVSGFTGGAGFGFYRGIKFKNADYVTFFGTPTDFGTTDLIMLSIFGSLMGGMFGIIAPISVPVITLAVAHEYYGS